jgi:CheY-like chemotaxis protein
VVVINIIDTGKGISSSFMKQNLFMPFTQESTLSAGLGLGMSMVRSIVNAMGGAIDVKSEVGVGTEVVVSLPLRHPSTPPASTSTPPTAEYRAPADFEDLLRRLKREECQMVAIFGFEETTNSRLSPLSQIKESLQKYLQDWFKLESYVLDAEDSPLNSIGAVIVNESQMQAFLAWRKAFALSDWRPAVVLVHDKSAKKYRPTTSHQVESRPPALLSKPFGPMKLAKALLFALDSTIDPSKPVLSSPDALETSVDSLDHTVKEAAKKVGPDTPYFNSSPGHDVEALPRSQGSDEYLNGGHSPGMSIEETIRSLSSRQSTETAPSTQKMDFGVLPIRRKVEKAQRPPRILVVDDNLINLSLIDMYIKKKTCQQTQKAENGSQAVDYVKEKGMEPFDVIFMDLSMPVMTGFEATRAIRQHEAAQRATLGLSAPSPALIVALTGLASSRDQRAAFECGVDRYLTKPVKFIEGRASLPLFIRIPGQLILLPVGRILEGWTKETFLGSSTATKESGS